MATFNKDGGVKADNGVSWRKAAYAPAAKDGVVKSVQFRYGDKMTVDLTKFRIADIYTLHNNHLDWKASLEMEGCPPINLATRFFKDKEGPRNFDRLAERSEAKKAAIKGAFDEWQKQRASVISGDTKLTTQAQEDIKKAKHVKQASFLQRARAAAALNNAKQRAASSVPIPTVE